MGFRASTRRKAKKLGITGFVRNKPNGSVHIEAEGTEKKLNNLVDWLEEGGPRFASVDNVKIEKGKLKNYQTFQIQR